MNIISVRVNDEERDILEHASKLYGTGISTLLKRMAFEKLEEEYDLAIVQDYEQSKIAGQVHTRPIEELWDEVEL